MRTIIRSVVGLAFAAAALGQQPQLDLCRGPSGSISVSLRHLKPSSSVVLRVSGNPLGLVWHASAATRSAYLAVRSDQAGRLHHELLGAHPHAAQLGLRVHVLATTSSGASWTGGGVVVGSDVANLRPPFEERGAWLLPPAALGLGGARVAVADIDQSGLEDAVLSQGAQLIAWVQDGQGGLADRTSTHLVQPGHAVGNLHLADMNGDGAVDLLVASGEPANHPDRLWLNQAGLLSPSVDLPTNPGVRTSAFLSGDLDGDGRLDLLLLRGETDHSTVGGKDVLLLQDAGGNYASSPAFDQAPWNDALTATTGGALADLDGDGDLDVFLIKADPGASSGSPGARNLLLINSGQGGFTDVSATRLAPHHKDNSYGCSPVDVDGDGDLDIVVANSLLGVSGGQSSDVLVNQGGLQGGIEGRFHDSPGSLPEQPPSSEAIRLEVACADFDLDGRGDVFFGVHDLPPGTGGHPLFLGAEGTSPSFQRVTSLDTGSFISGGLVLLDLSGDGDQDLLVTAAGSAGGGMEPFRARLFVNTRLGP